jgi:hypothetical protein
MLHYRWYASISHELGTPESTPSFKGKFVLPVFDLVLKLRPSSGFWSKNMAFYSAEFLEK